MTGLPPRWSGPADPGFGQTVARLSVSTWQPERVPAAVVGVRTEHDVVAAIQTAAEMGLRVSVRSGGHSLSAAHLAEGAITIDLRSLNGVEVDRDTATAWVEPGVTVAQAAYDLDRAGMAFPIGHAPTVGLGGYLLAGGNGWNTPVWGHGCERILAAEVVLPDGEQQLVDPHHPLFPALRGAGPLFPGVVLRFQLRLEPRAAQVQRGFATVPADHPEVLGRRIDDLLPDLPPSVESTVFWRPATSERPHAEATIALTSFDGTDPTAALKRHGWDATGTDRVSLASVVAGLPRHEGDALASDHLWTDAGYAQVLPRLPQHGEILTDCSSILLTTSSRRADGDLPQDAVYRPTGSLSVSPYAHWDPQTQPAAPQIDWTRQVTAGLADLATGHYVGEADLANGSDAVGRCFPTPVHAALRAVITEHDPAERMAWTAVARHQLQTPR